MASAVECKRGVEHDHDQVTAVSRRGREHAPSGVVGEPRLQAGRAGIAPQDAVQVVRVEGLVLRRGRDRDVLRRGDRGELRVVAIEVGRGVDEVVRASCHARARRARSG